MSVSVPAQAVNSQLHNVFLVKHWQQTGPELYMHSSLSHLNWWMHVQAALVHPALSIMQRLCISAYVRISRLYLYI